METDSEHDVVLDILCDRVDSEHNTTNQQNPPVALSPPLTVLGFGGLPVVVQDPVRFRKDIQDMVIGQMIRGIPSEDEFAEIEASGSMIQIATLRQMIKAAHGDIDSFKYMMDRVLGKPVNQTHSVTATVSYEQLLAEIDADEVITPKRVFCEDMSL